MLLIVSIGTQEEDSSQEENCKPCAIISQFFPTDRYGLKPPHSLFIQAPKKKAATKTKKTAKKPAAKKTAKKPAAKKAKTATKK